MKIAILSGKGGTGKTFIAVNLAATAKSAKYLDCDIEEPNGHLFFKPILEKEETIQLMLPIVDQELCTGCRKCVEFCKFNALAYIGGKLNIFEDICHSCGGCVLVCPEGALTEGTKTIGKIQTGKSGNVDVVTGIMNVGRATGVPIINKMIKDSEATAGSSESAQLRGADESSESAQSDGADGMPQSAEINGGPKLTIIDSPPGSACSVMEAIKDVDYCILVAEPTVFGAHNLQMVHELVRLFQKPYGVVLNKCTEEANPSEAYCKANDIPILAKIPFDRELGLLNAKGEIVVHREAGLKADPTSTEANSTANYKETFEEILSKILDLTPKKSESQEAELRRAAL